MAAYGIKRQDLFTDLKLDFKTPKDYGAVFGASRKASTYKKGEEYEKMPYFLADSFRVLIEDNSHAKSLQPSESKQSLSNKSTTGPAFGGSQSYKSEFLREKLVDQAEKKKRDRKNKQKLVKAPVNAKAKPAASGELNEDLIEVVDELKNDLVNKEREHEEMLHEFERLKLQNAQLIDQLKKL